MKYSFVFFFSLLFFATTPSCMKKEDFKGKMLNIAISQPIKGYDPIYANDRYSANEAARIYEGLLRYNYIKRPYVLEPDLAEEMPTISKDGLVYTFKIKKGVFFQDDEAFPGGKGRELVAEDFVYSLKRLADVKLQGLGWWLLQGRLKGLDQWRRKYSQLPKSDYGEEVEGLKAIDKYTLKFTLTKSFPQFLYALAMPFTFVVPREVVERYGKEFLNHPVGTGPFKIKGKTGYKQTKKIRYVKNPNFRKEIFSCEGGDQEKVKGLRNCGKQIPFVDAITVSVFEEVQPQWLNFEKGKIDYVSVPKDNFDAVIIDAKSLSPDFREKGISLVVSPSLDVTYLGFNHDLKLFKNKKLRQAMSLAYDVKTLNKLFYSNQAIVAQSIVPPGIAGYLKGFSNPYRGMGTEENIRRAKELLAEAGFPEGKGLPEITFDCPTGTTSFQMGEYFRDQMKKIGIKVKVMQNPFPELQRKITSRNMMTYALAWGADYPDAENFLQLLYGPNRSPGANGSGYDNPKFNTLFKKASPLQDSPARTALYEKMNRMAAEEMPLIYGVYRQSFVVKHAWLKNYRATDFNAGIERYLDIEKKEKKEFSRKL